MSLNSEKCIAKYLELDAHDHDHFHQEYEMEVSEYVAQCELVKYQVNIHSVM